IARNYILGLRQLVFSQKIAGEGCQLQD
ncbi:MAG: hypothetical protein RLZZ115_1229, partial [Cyanobacteriota bacterium]